MREFFNRDALQGHQKECIARSTASNIISDITKASGSSNVGVSRRKLQSNKGFGLQTDIKKFHQEKQFLAGLGLVPTSCAAVVRASRRDSKDVVCDVIMIGDSDEDENDIYRANQVCDLTLDQKSWRKMDTFFLTGWIIWSFLNSTGKRKS